MLEPRLPPLTYRRHTYGTSRNYHRKNQFKLMLFGPTSVSSMCYKLSALSYGVVRANSACRIRGSVSHLCGVPVTFGIMAESRPTIFGSLDHGRELRSIGTIAAQS